jgi:hypothetical protein
MKKSKVQSSNHNRVPIAVRTLLCLAACILPFSVFGQTPTPEIDMASAKPTPPPDAVVLDRVVETVRDALDQYKSGLHEKPDALPPLTTAVFDFKVTTATTVGGSINFFIFKIGGSHENDVVNDVTYTYTIPAAVNASRTPPKSPELTEELVKTIQSAAAAAKTAAALGKLKLTKIAVNIQFGVKWDASGGINAPISLVTVGINGDKNKNTVQSVTLTFGK